MSLAPIVIDLLVKGAPQVAQSFKGVQDAAVRAERAMLREQERAEKQRVASAQREAREKIKLHKAEEREVEKFGRDQVRIHQQARREVERIEERAHRTVLRRIHEEERARDRAAMSWVKSEEKAAREAQRARARFATGLVGAAGRGVVAGAQRVGNVAMGFASTAAQLGGGFSIADAVAQRGDLERNVALLGNSALGVGGVTKDDIDPRKIMARAKAASIATGVDAADLIAATQSYVAKSSDFKGGMANMEFFGELSKGTGAQLSDITNAAGIIRSQNKDLDAEGVKSMLLAVVKQGQQGSVELSDLAASAGKMTRTATSFSGEQTVNQQKLLGLSQIAVRTAGSPESAAIALSALGSDTRAHADAISAKLGYNVLDKGGKIVKSPEELLADVMGATGGNLAALGQHGGLGFTKPTMKIFEALKPEFDKAQAAWLREHKGDTKGANAAGAKASLAEMRQITGQTMGLSEMSGMAARVRETSADKFEASIRELKMAVGEELVPEFLKLIPIIKESTPAFVDLLKTGVPAFIDLIKAVADFAKTHKDLIHDIAAHPIGSLIAFEVTKSFAAAALPSLLQSLMRGAFGAGGGSAPGAVASGGGGGAGVIVAGAAAQAYSAYDLVSGTRGAIKQGQAEGGDIAKRLASGDVSAQAELARAQEQASGTNVARAWGDRATRAVSTLLNPAAALGGYASDAAMSAMGMQSEGERSKQTLKASEIVDTVALQKATTDAIANGVREGVKQGNNSGPSGAGRSEPIINR
jgi:hypothetical protein